MKFLLLELDLDEVVLLELFEVVVARDDEFFAVEGEAEGVRGEGHVAEDTIRARAATGAREEVVGKGETGEEFGLAWVVYRGEEYPLSLVLQTFVVVILNYLSNRVKMLIETLERHLLGYPLTDKVPNNDNYLGPHLL